MATIKDEFRRQETIGRETIIIILTIIAKINKHKVKEENQEEQEMNQTTEPRRGVGIRRQRGQGS